MNCPTCNESSILYRSEGKRFWNCHKCHIMFGEVSRDIKVKGCVCSDCCTKRMMTVEESEEEVLKRGFG